MRRVPLSVHNQGRGYMVEPEPLNQLDYADDPAEFEVQKELRRMGIQNEPKPTACPTCQGELEQSSGFAGETILFCQACHSIAWEDSEGAIRNVI